MLICSRLYRGIEELASISRVTPSSGLLIDSESAIIFLSHTKHNGNIKSFIQKYRLSISSQPFDFLGLPQEIRDKIYNLVQVSDTFL